ncbi:MAG: hypothetical protein K9H49_14230 [Bacteroidales bacterium]|nr:hypothetical protein [Bacteroidales bacterium]MCF8392217.1 hypothetical protein [Bacteroidales bacterium]
MKRAGRIILPILIIAYMVLFLSFSANRNEELLCNDLQIIMKDTLKSEFLKKRDIENLVLKEEKELLGYPVNAINIRSIEAKIRTLPYVKEAEMYYDLNGIMYVKTLQREPVVKVLSKTGKGYYLDSEGFLFSPKGDFTPFIMIANGSFTEGNELKTIRNISELSEMKKYKEWSDLIKIVNFINKDEFWKSQMVQIYFNKEQEFELIPRVGAHQIILGDAENLAVKFRNLKILYKEGLTYEGWNKYEKINLKYNNQVICSKR